VHPQLVTTSGDTITQYDVFGPHVSRMITPVGLPSEHVTREVSDDEILRSMLLTRGDASIEVPEGRTVRGVLADRMRAQLAAKTGRDFGHLSDAEALDGIEYFVFPNFAPWGGYLTPLVYRFRPWGDDPGQCLMEVMLLEPLPAGERPDPAPRRFLTDDERFADAPELGFLGPILDQDTATVARVQRGPAGVGVRARRRWRGTRRCASGTSIACSRVPRRLRSEANRRPWASLRSVSPNRASSCSTRRSGACSATAASRAPQTVALVHGVPDAGARRRWTFAQLSSGRAARARSSRRARAARAARTVGADIAGGARPRVRRGVGRASSWCS
jgi:hypothetical protein